MTVSSHALTAIFHVPENRDLGKGLGDQVHLISNRFVKKSQEMNGQKRIDN
jgi:hypothetical protein